MVERVRTTVSKQVQRIQSSEATRSVENIQMEEGGPNATQQRDEGGPSNMQFEGGVECEGSASNMGDQYGSSSEDKGGAGNPDDSGFLLTNLFPGGPTTLYLIPSFKTHIASDIWYTGDCSKTKNWKVNPKCDSEFLKIVNDSGLDNLKTCSYKMTNKVLFFAFTEQWQPETNTFHFPFSKMTITLDVKQILGIPMDGFPLSAENLSHFDGATLIEEQLGIPRNIARGEFGTKSTATVQFEWLLANFRDKICNGTGSMILEQAVKAYLLFLVGCTLFANKSRTQVSMSYLRYFSDLSEVY